MRRQIILSLLVAIAVTVWLGELREADAQGPVAVTTFYPASPVVARVPVRYGLFGRRVITRPVVVYPSQAAFVAPVAPVPVTTFYAPTVGTSVFYAPAPVHFSPLPTPLYWRP